MDDNHDLTIEFEPPSTSACECCGGQNTRLTRYVTRDGNAYAVYFAMFSELHDLQHVSVLISMGDWDEEASPSARCAFYLRIRSTQEAFQVGVYDSEQSPWGEVEIFGPTLSREEALKHPRLKEVFVITDLIVEQDRPLLDYLHHHQIS
ncbi:MAG: hypothetical protein IAF94_08875 [Pirellulaceae bacterium]|nr:hypothetical protein [Pirellulaceae bacterium]